MPIASTTTNYTGRTVDVSVFQYPNALISDIQPMSLAIAPTGRICAGVQKLAQKYAILLLTDIGSQEYFPEEGTQFLRDLRSGAGTVDRISAIQTFSLASYKVVNKLKSYQSATDNIPTDEQIASATLTNLTLYGGYVGFDVFITTMAGTSLAFVVPLPI